jgi:hypothetical protein
MAPAVQEALLDATAANLVRLLCTWKNDRWL